MMLNKVQDDIRRALTCGNEQKSNEQFLLKIFVFIQDEKTVSKLMAEIKEAHEILNKHKTDNNVSHKIHRILWNTSHAT